MNEESRKFRKKYRMNLPYDARINPANNGRDTHSERLTAKKGTAYRAKKATKNKKIGLRIASLILAAGIGVGTLTAIGSINKDEQPTITQMQEMGIDADDLGLQSDTADMMRKYDEYFENFDDKEADLTEQEVENLAKDIEDLNFNVIKDKIADLCGVERNDVTLAYRFERGDGTYSTSINVKEDKYGKEETFRDDASIAGIGRKDTIPDEISDLIVQIGSYEDIIKDMQADHISKVNAVKEIKKLYDKIIKIATKEFTLDKDGNVVMKDYQTKEEKEIGE